MLFSEQIQRCGGLSAEQALDLRAFIVEASERQHANPSVFSMSLQTLRQKLVYQGFDWDDLLGTLQQLAKGSLEATKQAAFAADCEMFMARDASIAEFASMLSADYSDLQKVLEQLVEAAQEDQRSLMAIAGGTSTWKATPNATKKQKSKKIGIDIAEVAALGITVGGVGFCLYRNRRNRGGAAEDNPFHNLIPAPKRLTKEEKRNRRMEARQKWDEEFSGIDARSIPDPAARVKFNNAVTKRTIEIKPSVIKREGSKDELFLERTLIDSRGEINPTPETDLKLRKTPKLAGFQKKLIKIHQSYPIENYDFSGEVLKKFGGKFKMSDNYFDNKADELPDSNALPARGILKNLDDSSTKISEIDPRRLSHEISDAESEGYVNFDRPYSYKNSSQFPNRMSGQLDNDLSEMGGVVERELQAAAADVARDAAGDVSRVTEEAVDGVIDEDNPLEDVY